MLTKRSVINFYILSGLMLSVVNSNAELSLGADPYLGVDYKITYTEGRDYWKKILPTNKVYQYVSLFAGLQLNDYLSTEIAYASSFKFTKHSDLNGQIMWNQPAPANSMQDVKLSYKNWHIDLNILYPNDKNLALLFFCGLSLTKPKIFAENISGNNINNAITELTGKNKLLPRLGVGFQIAKGFFGVRSRIIWENTSRLQLEYGSLNTRFPEITKQAFKNTYVWSLGMFFKI